MEANPNIRTKANHNSVWQRTKSQDNYTFDIGMRPTEMFMKFNDDEFFTHDGSKNIFDSNIYINASTGFSYIGFIDMNGEVNSSLYSDIYNSFTFTTSGENASIKFNAGNDIRIEATDAIVMETNNESIYMRGLPSDDTVDHVVAISDDVNGTLSKRSVASIVASLPGSGTGDVTKVGTPASPYLAYWTGDGTLAASTSIKHHSDPGLSLTGTGYGNYYVYDTVHGDTVKLGLTYSYTYGCNLQGYGNNNTTRGNDFYIGAGQGGSTTEYQKGGDLKLAAGRGGGSTSSDGGDIILSPGHENTYAAGGVKGDLYIGSSEKDEAYLTKDTSATSVLSYDTSTGKVRYTDMIRTSETTLTQSQIQSLNSSPVTLIAAPGSDKVIHVISIMYSLTYDTAAFSSGNTQIEYSGGNNITNAVFNVDVSNDTIFSVSSIYSNPVANESLRIIGSSDYTGGGTNSTLKVSVIYQIFDV